MLAAGIAGCGIGAAPAPETTSAPEGSALPAQTAATDAPAGATDEDGPSPRANENPGILVTPAGGGGIVVGDPLEGGRAGAAGPAVAPVAATAVAQATAPAATPEQAAAAPQERRRSKKGREEEEEEAAPVAAAAAPAATPVVPVIPGLGSEPGDEPPPNARPNLQTSPAGAPAGATAEDGSGFLSKRQEAEADAARAAAAADAAARSEAAATAAEDGRVEDVDSPPATAQGNSNASLERGFGGGRKGKDEDGNESFAPGVAPGQPGGEIAIKRGSAEEVTETFFSLIAAGQVEKVAPLIGGRATGLLGRLRDGTATPEEIEELKGLAMVRQQENSRPKGGMHRLLTFRADKKMMLVEAEQKEEDSAVVKLDIRDAPRRRK